MTIANFARLTAVAALLPLAVLAATPPTKQCVGSTNTAKACVDREKVELTPMEGVCVYIDGSSCTGVPLYRADVGAGVVTVNDCPIEEASCLLN